MADDRGGGDGFSHSMIDLMTSIAVIFILLFLAFLKNEEEEIAVRKRVTRSNVDELFAELEGEFSAGIDVRKDRDDPLTLLVVLRDDPDLLSFDYNRFEVRPKSREFLGDFIPKLVDVVCSPRGEGLIDSVIIEGHTDSRGNDDSNTVLSSQRATEVLVESRRVLEQARKEGVPDAARLERCFLHFSQASGRGEQDLLMVDGKEDRAGSRRVVVKIRVKSVEQREEAIDQLQAMANG